MGPNIAILAELVSRLNEADRRKSPLAYDEITDLELDARGDFVFVGCNGGSASPGTIRLRFTERRNVSVTRRACSSPARGSPTTPVVDVAKDAALLAEDPVLGATFPRLVHRSSITVTVSYKLMEWAPRTGAQFVEFGLQHDCHMKWDRCGELFQRLLETITVWSDGCH